MTRVFAVEIEYSYNQRERGKRGVAASYVDRGLPELMERLALAHPEAHSVKIVDQGEAQ